ncbi:MAG: DNA polymerase III subunit gamma/tau [Cellvibrio sp.]
MSYQVLARKWRPRIFREMVGQEHVLQALINALDNNRLHHAYLFTGTRGVGKTTIARILAKCLNCEKGVSSEPCGECSSCREIAEGRFVDLIEVDAASRTKVEDTRELLENVQYAPTRGRYKVYLIDEVHMLSNSSFNALLKTLEEPPPHVKFLLATTDPQKLPMTILSRCLQFNLKNMNPERIVSHLKFVLGEESVPFEESALWHLGRAADGSMRDAMSLTDQAIAYGSGKILESDVSAMLGTIDRASVYEILEALAQVNGRELLAAVDRMSEQAPDYASALAEILSLLHRIAIAQALPEAVDNSHGDREKVLALALQMPSEDVQLYYQTALLGRRDLPLAPDPRSGFEMVLLRMLAFKPQGVIELPKKPLPNSSPAVRRDPAPANASPSAQRQAAPTINDSVHEQSPQSPSRSESATESSSQPTPATTSEVMNASSSDAPPFDGPYTPAPVSAHISHAPLNEAQLPALSKSEAQPNHFAETINSAMPDSSEPPADYEVYAAQQSVNSSEDYSEHAMTPAVAPPVLESEAVESAQPSGDKVTPELKKIALAEAGPHNWIDIYTGLGVAGILQSTVSNSQLEKREHNHFYFVLDRNTTTLYSETHQQRLADELTRYFGEPIQATIRIGDVVGDTPAAVAIRLRAERQANAEKSIHNDPIVQALIAQFDAVIREDSIVPLN